MQGLSASNIAVAGRLGIHEGQILQQLSGRSARLRTGNAKAAAAGVCQDHARFASACMLNELLCEVPAWLVAEEWGAPQKLSAAGVCLAHPSADVFYVILNEWLVQRRQLPWLPAKESHRN